MSDFLTVPLTHARIGYDNRIQSARASSEQLLHPAWTMLEPNTYENWMPSQAGSSELLFDLGSQVEIDYVALGAHTLGTANADVFVSTSAEENGPWEEVATISPGTDTPLMFLFEERSCRFVRVQIEADSIPSIAVAHAGIALAMQRAIYGGVTPLPMARLTDIRPNYSETGQFLGRRVISEGIDWSATWNNLSSSWYRSRFEPFVKRAKRLPFFLAWRPETFPGDVAYCWTTGDIIPTNAGIGRGLMSVGLSVRGVAAWEPDFVESRVVINGVQVVINGSIVIVRG